MPRQHINCIVFRKNKESYEFLLLKRIEKEGDFWQPVSGGVAKSDNSLIDAVYRELKEESGIEKAKILKIIDGISYYEIDKHYLTNKKVPLLKEYVYACEVKCNTQIDISKNIPQEHIEFRWVSFDEALKMLKWENNKEAFKKLNKILTANK